MKKIYLDDPESIRDLAGTYTERNTNMTAKTQVLVDVTADDIRLGVRSSACECPVARAVKRATGKQTVRVTPGAITIGGMTVLNTTSKIYDFIVAFDAGKMVEGFDFWLDLA